MNTTDTARSRAVDAGAIEAGCVLPLAELSRADRDRIGVKAANLAHLTRAGFSVPDAWVLGTDAFSRFLADSGLGPQSGMEAVLAAPMPADVAEALESVAACAGDAALAVRSSAVAEDLAGASFAGQYETVLNVRGAEALKAAVKQCWASAFDPRVDAYQGAVDGASARSPQMAVLIQYLVPADASGVAFSANPVTGERAETVISAVRGLGERLVAGEARADEWIVRGAEATCQARPERALEREQVLAVAGLARTVEAYAGCPQDIEWAMAGGDLFLLQARPITALPEPVEWRARAEGAFTRNFRLGEWLGDPVTPLCASWLLRRLDERLYSNYRRIAGAPTPRPQSVIVNGWYFATLNFLPATPAGMLWMLVRHILPRLVVRPRRVAMMNPGTAKFGVELFVRDWHDEVLPGYRQAVAQAKTTVEALEPAALIELVDGLADAAGDYFTNMTCVTGFAWKSEIPLATFYREHVAPRIGGSHQRLLGGFSDVAVEPPAHAVSSLDWFFPTMGERGQGSAVDAEVLAQRRTRSESARRQGEAETRQALAGESKLLARFERLVATAQRFARLREEQVPTFTLAWPVMRRAVHRLGEALVERGLVAEAEEVHFLELDELSAALADPAVSEEQRRDAKEVGESTAERELVGSLEAVVRERRNRWERQRRLVPPLMIGEMTPMARKMFAGIERAFEPPAESAAAAGAAEAAHAIVRGLPASAGRATGPARVIRSADEFDRVRPGDVLVAPATTPSWTPLFGRVAAVVTDAGSPIAHASVVAREYGIPAVVATGDATARLVDGQRVTVNGDSGVVVPR